MSKYKRYYQKRQNQLREQAIDWQMKFSDGEVMYYSDLAEACEYFSYWGKRKFREVLNYEVELRRPSYDDLICIVHVDDPDEKIWTRKLRKAKELFESLAGYCAAEDYDKWFKEV